MSVRQEDFDFGAEADEAVAVRLIADVGDAGAAEVSSRALPVTSATQEFRGIPHNRHSVERTKKARARQFNCYNAVMEFEVQRVQDSRQKWEEARPILRGMGIMLLAVGAFFLGSGLYGGAQKYWRIGRWTSVEAQVLDFNVVREPCGRASNCYRAYFTFQYEAGGRRLIAGTQSDHTGSYSSEMSDWSRYQRGGQQQIRYNPAQPQEITIDGVNVRSFREPLKLGGWGAGLVLIGLLFRR